ncbi:O-acetyl-ADP-ribose deacetylase [candidate division WOR-3 bacterium]|uniref:O-acetyl-ADP-ribose deacetylase n=1 Tax=candidate division WOR-3 bacterium TaxID=2052148 RepID=A0A660SHS8_UNCW3|nr:MAG: O-acetyl-ADP-ribose deacetylase [candidate division WOR-3 bacterium]
MNQTRLILTQGDITEQDTDAIVNAANPSLMGGGGVDGAIHRKGGPKILEECKRIREEKYPDGLPTGQAVVTSGGRLKARYVIHTVGPIWRGGNRGEEELLAEAYRNCLRRAIELKLRSIAFPSISTGAYGYPIDQAAEIALRTVKEYIKEFDQLEQVVFVLFRAEDLQVYQTTAAKIFGTKPHGGN